MSVLKKDTESREKREIVKAESEGEAEDCRIGIST